MDFIRKAEGEAKQPRVLCGKLNILLRQKIAIIAGKIYFFAKCLFVTNQKILAIIQLRLQ